MLDIYLRTKGRKNPSMNLRTWKLLGFKVRPTQEKKGWSSECWALRTWLTLSVSVCCVTASPPTLSGLKDFLFRSRAYKLAAVPGKLWWPKARRSAETLLSLCPSRPGGWPRPGALGSPPQGLSGPAGASGSKSRTSADPRPRRFSAFRLLCPLSKASPSQPRCKWGVGKETPSLYGKSRQSWVLCNLLGWPKVHLGFSVSCCRTVWPTQYHITPRMSIRFAITSWILLNTPFSHLIWVFPLW